jgi:hypothetical protein
MDDEGHLHSLNDKKDEDCGPCPSLCEQAARTKGERSLYFAAPTSTLLASISFSIQA